MKAKDIYKEIKKIEYQNAGNSSVIDEKVERLIEDAITEATMCVSNYKLSKDVHSLRCAINSVLDTCRLRSFGNQSNWFGFITEDIDDDGKPIRCERKQLFFPSWGCLDNPSEYLENAVAYLDQVLKQTSVID